MRPITLAHALEAAANADTSLGFRFISDDGVPGFSEAGKETFFSFTTLERESSRYAGAFQAMGLQKGDRLAMILPTNEEFVLSFFGALRAGIIPVPVYPPLGLGQLQGYLDNTRHIVAKSGSRALITSGQIKKLLGTVQADSPALEQVVAVESIRESRAPFKAEKITPDDVAFIQYTSGSTSRPKGVALTHGNLMANIKCIMNDGLQMQPEGEFGVSWLPLFHDMGLIGFVLAPLVDHIPIAYLPPLLFLKRPVSWFQAMTKYKGTIAYAPNFAFALCVKRIRERELQGIDLSSWKRAGCGAEPIRPETLEAFASAFAKVGFDKNALLPSYGMAESSLAIAFTELYEGMKTLNVHGSTLWETGEVKIVPEEDDGAIRLVSCGKEFPAHSIRIFSPEDTEGVTPLPENRVGEIRIKGPSVMKGYWEDAEKTKETFTGEYLKTGDLGFLSSGHLYICGRSKEVVIINGRNYYPQDIEWEASKVDGVRRGNVIAFGAKDPTGKEQDRERVVCVFEVQDAKTAEDPSKIDALTVGVRKAVQEGMSLSLDDVVAVAPGVLPKTSSGKLQRTRTRELYENDELRERKGARQQDKLSLVKHAAMSQLSYFKLAVLGGRKKKP